MPPKSKQILQNRLWQARKRLGLKQKQVASFIRQKTPNPLSQYEQGIALPNLETAFRLSTIYGIPVRALFFDLDNRIKREFATDPLTRERIGQLEEIEAYCSMADDLHNPKLTLEEYRRAKKHSIEMIHKIGDLHSKGRYLSE